MESTCTQAPAMLPPVRKRSAKQAEASRQNGCRSRGPKTPAGKQKASQNAIRTGLFCKNIPEYRYPIYYSRRDVADLAADVAAQLGCRSTFTHTLAESVASDMLRLRHIRSLEHALLDPDVGQAKDLESAHQQQRGCCIQKTEPEHVALLAAATKVRDGLAAETPFVLAPTELDLVTDELWGRMTCAHRACEVARAEIQRLDESLKSAAPDDVEWLQDERKTAEQNLQEAEERCKKEDVGRYGIHSKDELEAVLTNAMQVPHECRTVWSILANETVYNEMSAIRQIEDGQLRIEMLRRNHILQGMHKMDQLNLLADYEAKIQRHMERTLTMIREIEGLSVLDVPA